jgi:hypothetical protein
VTIAAPRAVAASRNAGATMTHAAVVAASCFAYSGLARNEIDDGVADSSGSIASIRVSGSPISSPPSRSMMSRSRTSPTLQRPLLAAAWALSALITLSVMSTFGLQNTASCRMRSYFSVSKICLMTRLVRSTTVASSSFLRWLRSSWNSRGDAAGSRSWSTSSRWRRVRSASARVGASLSRRSLAAFSGSRAR